MTAQVTEYRVSKNKISGNNKIVLYMDEDSLVSLNYFKLYLYIMSLKFYVDSAFANYGYNTSQLG